MERLQTTVERDPATGLFLRPQQIYVAGRVAYGLEPVRELYDQLEDLGHGVTYRWADVEDVRKPYRQPDNRTFNQAVQANMLQGAAAADVFILLSDPVTAESKGLHGALMEWGAFLADCGERPEGRLGYIVGPNSRQSIFDSPSYIRFPEYIEEVMTELNFLEGMQRA